MKTHFTWSIELPGDQCPHCQSKTQLIAFVDAKPVEMDDPPFEGYLEDWLTPDDEISGHFCPRCRKIVSLSLNTH